VDCYNDALNAALVDHADRRGVTPREAIESHDYFVVHVPFHKMAVTGLTKLVERHLEVDPAGAHEFLEAHHFDDGIEASRWIGNIYSGSAYMALMFLLWNRYRAEGDGIVGKRILLASYGSGNTMTVLSATVAAGAPEVLAGWDLSAVIEAGVPAGFDRYERFIRDETYSLDHGPVTDGSDVDPGALLPRGDPGRRIPAVRVPAGMSGTIQGAPDPARSPEPDQPRDSARCHARRRMRRLTTTPPPR
jgi:hypothetical protein